MLPERFWKVLPCWAHTDALSALHKIFQKGWEQDLSWSVQVIYTDLERNICSFWSFHFTLQSIDQWQDLAVLIMTDQSSITHASELRDPCKKNFKVSKFSA